MRPSYDNYVSLGLISDRRSIFFFLQQNEHSKLHSKIRQIKKKKKPKKVFFLKYVRKREGMLYSNLKINV